MTKDDICVDKRVASVISYILLFVMISWIPDFSFNYGMQVRKLEQDMEQQTDCK